MATNPDNTGMSTERQLERFFAGLRQQLRVVKNAKRDRDLFLAQEFSVFDYVDISETKLSQIVACYEMTVS